MYTFYLVRWFGILMCKCWKLKHPLYIHLDKQVQEMCGSLPVAYFIWNVFFFYDNGLEHLWEMVLCRRFKVVIIKNKFRKIFFRLVSSLPTLMFIYVVNRQNFILNIGHFIVSDENFNLRERMLVLWII